MENRISLLLVTLVFVTLGALPTTSQTRYFRTFKEVKDDYIRRQTNGGKEPMNMSKLRVKEVDLNGDGKVDYWLVNDELDCGSSGCWGSSYLWTSKGYCEGYPMKEDEITRKKLPRNKCKPELGPERTW